MKSESSIRSVLKAISVLKLFTPVQPELSIADIGRKNGVPKTTARRIVITLAQAGLLEKDETTGKYMIGPMLYSIGNLYLSTKDVVRTAEPVIKALNDLSGEAVNVSIFNNGYITFVMKEETKHAFRWSIHVGTIMPAYASAMGKALLSELTDTELDNLYPEEKLRPLTNKTVATKTELKRELEQIRKTGVAFNREGGHEGVEGIAAVIRDIGGKAVAAMSVTVQVFRMNQTYRQRLATLVRMGSSLISYRLGYQHTASPVRDIQEIRDWWEQKQPDLAFPVKDLT